MQSTSTGSSFIIDTYPVADNGNIITSITLTNIHIDKVCLNKNIYSYFGLIAFSTVITNMTATNIGYDFIVLPGYKSTNFFITEYTSLFFYHHFEESATVYTSLTISDSYFKKIAAFEYSFISLREFINPCNCHYIS